MERIRRTKAEILDGIDHVKAKKIAHNTYQYEREDGTTVVRFHLTDIITRKPNGDIVLNSGGFRTFTTKDRFSTFLRDYLPNATVYQESSVWYFQLSSTAPSLLFADNMTIKANGKVEGTNGLDKAAMRKRKREIVKYSKGYVKALFAGKVPKPDNGDCWMCLMFPQTGDASHLLSHMEEKYYVPSLLTRAVEAFDVSPFAKSVVGTIWQNGVKPDVGSMDDIAAVQLTKSIKRYLYSQLGFAS